MNTYLHRRRPSFFYKVVSAVVAFTFIFSSILPPTPIYAQTLPASLLNLPLPGTMVSLTSGFNPPMVKGITIHPDNPLKFDFLVSPGDDRLEGQEFRKESKRLIKYFLAGLTVPDDQLWVNLSPYEQDRVISQQFGQTEMGRDMLAQDYILKQLSASLMYPENELGQKFWDRVYKKAYEQYGTTDIPMNTFNKIWIVPDTAVVYEHDHAPLADARVHGPEPEHERMVQGQTAFVVESHLKVMLEEDYLALQNNLGESQFGLDSVVQEDAEIISGVSSEVVREVLIPEIEKEVNEGEIFTQLRQIYNSVILASWYKDNLKQSLLGQVYVDQGKTKGVDIQDKQINQKIYDQYVEAFKKGVYNYIKEDIDPVTNELIPRKYFSGGSHLNLRATGIRQDVQRVATDKQAQVAASEVERVVVNLIETDESETNIEYLAQVEDSYRTAASPIQKGPQEEERKWLVIDSGRPLYAGELNDIGAGKYTPENLQEVVKTLKVSYEQASQKKIVDTDTGAMETDNLDDMKHDIEFVEKKRIELLGLGGIDPRDDGPSGAASPVERKDAADLSDPMELARMGLENPSLTLAERIRANREYMENELGMVLYRGDYEPEDLESIQLDRRPVYTRANRLIDWHYKKLVEHYEAGTGIHTMGPGSPEQADAFARMGHLLQYFGGWWANARRGYPDTDTQSDVYNWTFQDEVTSLLDNQEKSQKVRMSKMNPEELEAYMQDGYMDYENVGFVVDLDIGMSEKKVDDMIDKILAGRGMNETRIVVLHIEDQEDKRCGHLPCKTLKNIDAVKRVIKRVHAKFEKAGIRTMLMFRTDALDSEWVNKSVADDQYMIMGATNLVKQSYDEAVAKAEARRKSADEIEKIKTKWRQDANVMTMSDAVARALSLRGEDHKVMQWLKFAKRKSFAQMEAKAQKDYGITIIDRKEWLHRQSENPDFNRNKEYLFFDVELPAWSVDSYQFYLMESGVETVKARFDQLAPWATLVWFEDHKIDRAALQRSRDVRQALDETMIKWSSEHIIPSVLEAQFVPEQRGSKKRALINRLKKYQARKLSGEETTRQLIELGFTAAQATRLKGSVRRFMGTNVSASINDREANEDGTPVMSDQYLLDYARQIGEVSQYNFKTYGGGQMNHIFGLIGMYLYNTYGQLFWGPLQEVGFGLDVGFGVPVKSELLIKSQRWAGVDRSGAEQLHAADVTSDGKGGTMKQFSAKKQISPEVRKELVSLVHLLTGRVDPQTGMLLPDTDPGDLAYQVWLVGYNEGDLVNVAELSQLLPLTRDDFTARLASDGFHSTDNPDIMVRLKKSGDPTGIEPIFLDKEDIDPSKPGVGSSPIKATIDKLLQEKYASVFGDKQVNGRTLNVEETIGKAAERFTRPRDMRLAARADIIRLQRAGVIKPVWNDPVLGWSNPNTKYTHPLYGATRTVAEIRKGMIDNALGIKSKEAWRLNNNVHPSEKFFRKGLELTGPRADLGMAIRAINAAQYGIVSDMPDYEDATPDEFWAKQFEQVESIGKMYDGTLDKGEVYHHPIKKRDYVVEVAKKDFASLVARIPGLALKDRRIFYKDKKVSETVTKFILHLLNNFDKAQENTEEGFAMYIPKIESPEEALFLAHMIMFGEEAIGVEHGTIKFKMLNERHGFSRHQEVIMWILAPWLLGTNVGRWDYTNSLFELHLGSTTGEVFMDPSKFGMASLIGLHPYSRRNAILNLLAGIDANGEMTKGAPIGGMFAGMKTGDKKADEAALKAIFTDKLRERLTGLFYLNGRLYDTYHQSWIASPETDYVVAGARPLQAKIEELEGLVQELTPEQFKTFIKLGLINEQGKITAYELTQERLDNLWSEGDYKEMYDVAKGEVTIEELEYSLYMASEYGFQILNGNNAAKIADYRTGGALMNDFATYEIFWHWIKHIIDNGAKLTADGTTVRGTQFKKGTVVTFDTIKVLLDERSKTVEEYFEKHPENPMNFDRSMAPVIMEVLERQFKNDEFITYGARVLIALRGIEDVKTRNAIMEAIFSPRKEAVAKIQRAKRNKRSQVIPKLALEERDFIYDYFPEYERSILDALYHSSMNDLRKLFESRGVNQVTHTIDAIRDYVLKLSDKKRESIGSLEELVQMVPEAKIINLTPYLREDLATLSAASPVEVARESKDELRAELENYLNILERVSARVDTALEDQGSQIVAYQDALQVAQMHMNSMMTDSSLFNRMVQDEQFRIEESTIKEIATVSRDLKEAAGDHWNNFARRHKILQHSIDALRNGINQQIKRLASSSVIHNNEDIQKLTQAFRKPAGERGAYEKVAYEIKKDKTKDDRFGWANRPWELTDGFLAHVEEEAARMKTYTPYLGIIAMGGESSSIGAYDPSVMVFDTTSPNAFERELEGKDLSEITWFVISNSFSTKETLTNASYIEKRYEQEGLDPAEHIIYFTNPENENKHDKKVNGFDVRFRERYTEDEREATSTIGGRNTLMTYPALLAYAFRNPGQLKNMVEAVKSAYAFKDGQMNPWIVAAYRTASFVQSVNGQPGKNKLAIIQPDFIRTRKGLTEQQQFEESLGKSDDAFTVYTEWPDLETLKRMKDEGWLFLELQPIGQVEATREYAQKALLDGHPVITVDIPSEKKFSPEVSFYGLQTFVATLGVLLNINVSDQEPVEAYKELMREKELTLADILVPARENNAVLRNNGDLDIVIDGLLNRLTDAQKSRIAQMQKEGEPAFKIFAQALYDNHDVDALTVAYYDDVDQEAGAFLDKLTTNIFQNTMGYASKDGKGTQVLHGLFVNWFAGPSHQLPLQIVATKYGDASDPDFHAQGQKVIQEGAAASHLALANKKEDNRPVATIVVNGELNRVTRNQIENFFTVVASEVNRLRAASSPVTYKPQNWDFAKMAERIDAGKYPSRRMIARLTRDYRNGYVDIESVWFIHEKLISLYTVLKGSYEKSKQLSARSRMRKLEPLIDDLAIALREGPAVKSRYQSKLEENASIAMPVESDAAKERLIRDELNNYLEIIQITKERLAVVLRDFSGSRFDTTYKDALKVARDQMAGISERGHLVNKLFEDENFKVDEGIIVQASHVSDLIHTTFKDRPARFGKHYKSIDNSINELSGQIKGQINRSAASPVEDIQDVVLEVVSQYIGREDITEKDHFTNDLGLDSLDMAELVLDIETKAKSKKIVLKPLEFDAIENNTTIGDLINHFRNHVISSPVVHVTTKMVESLWSSYENVRYTALQNIIEAGDERTKAALRESNALQNNVKAASYRESAFVGDDSIGISIAVTKDEYDQISEYFIDSPQHGVPTEGIVERVIKVVMPNGRIRFVNIMTDTESSRKPLIRNFIERFRDQRIHHVEVWTDEIVQTRDALQKNAERKGSSVTSDWEIRRGVGGAQIFFVMVDTKTKDFGKVLVEAKQRPEGPTKASSPTTIEERVDLIIPLHVRGKDSARMDPDIPLSYYGADSLDIVEAVMHLESEFEIDIDESAVDFGKITRNSLIELVKSKTSASPVEAVDEYKFLELSFNVARGAIKDALSQSPELITEAVEIEGAIDALEDIYRELRSETSEDEADKVAVGVVEEFIIGLGEINTQINELAGTGISSPVILREAVEKLIEAETVYLKGHRELDGNEEDAAKLFAETDIETNKSLLVSRLETVEAVFERKPNQYGPGISDRGPDIIKDGITNLRRLLDGTVSPKNYMSVFAALKDQIVTDERTGTSSSVTITLEQSVDRFNDAVREYQENERKLRPGKKEGALLRLKEFVSDLIQKRVEARIDAIELILERPLMPEDRLSLRPDGERVIRQGIQRIKTRFERDSKVTARTPDLTLDTNRIFLSEGQKTTPRTTKKRAKKPRTARQLEQKVSTETSLDEERFALSSEEINERLETLKELVSEIFHAVELRVSRTLEDDTDTKSQQDLFQRHHYLKEGRQRIGLPSTSETLRDINNQLDSIEGSFVGHMGDAARSQTDYQVLYEDLQGNLEQVQNMIDEALQEYASTSEESSSPLTKEDRQKLEYISDYAKEADGIIAEALEKYEITHRVEGLSTALSNAKSAFARANMQSITLPGKFSHIQTKVETIEQAFEQGFQGTSDYEQVLVDISGDIGALLSQIDKFSAKGSSSPAVSYKPTHWDYEQIIANVENGQLPPRRKILQLLRDFRNGYVQQDRIEQIEETYDALFEKIRVERGERWERGDLGFVFAPNRLLNKLEKIKTHLGPIKEALGKKMMVSASPVVRVRHDEIASSPQLRELIAALQQNVIDKGIDDHVATGHIPILDIHHRFRISPLRDAQKILGDILIELDTLFGPGSPNIFTFTIGSEHPRYSEREHPDTDLIIEFAAEAGALSSPLETFDITPGSEIKVPSDTNDIRLLYERTLNSRMVGTASVRLIRVSPGKNREGGIYVVDLIDGQEDFKLIHDSVTLFDGDGIALAPGSRKEASVLEAELTRDYIRIKNNGTVDLRVQSSSPIQIVDQDLGGINLNPALLDLQIKRDGNGIPLPVQLQPISDFHIEGFLPVIINVTPVNLPLLLGWDLGDEEKETDYGYDTLDPTDQKKRFELDDIEEVAVLN